ncbi:kelch-like protein 40b [Scaptodrosophila lebanonensis]|uniref:Kelch-like protein 40b n=1 Tax=Drosophila lebanonensis TaxID=7225 RepID=A0A6J2UHP5_DROLE|nr:kelch-like protein 40b [Scaptodrosophila lebanonensis]
MDEVMRQNAAHHQEADNPVKRELTCSVHFTNPKFKPESSLSSDDELGSVTRLVSKPEDLELEHVFKRTAKPGALVYATNRSLLSIGYDFEEARDWLTAEQPQKEQLTKVLRYMMETHSKATVQIDINKMYFNCHLAVLQVYSKFFMELEQTPVVITLPEDKVSQKAFMLIYKWMLSDEPYLERKDILNVFVAASYLRVDDLLSHCWMYFDDESCFNEETACILYLDTQCNPALDVVRNVMLTRIHKFLLTFVATRDFLNLPVKHLLYLLSSNTICVNTEVEILFIAVRWLSHDWALRRVHLLKLITCVRFSLMPLWYLLCVRQQEPYKLLNEIVNFSDVDEMINEAIASITSTIYDSQLEGKRVDHASLLKGSNKRMWIRDQACPYYHRVGCPNTRDIRYAHFVTYLKALQQQPNDSFANVQFLDLDDDSECCNGVRLI